MTIFANDLIIEDLGESKMNRFGERYVVRKPGQETYYCGPYKTIAACKAAITYRKRLEAKSEARNA